MAHLDSMSSPSPLVISALSDLGSSQSSRQSSRAAPTDPLGIVRKTAEFPSWLTTRESFRDQMRDKFGSIEPPKVQPDMFTVEEDDRGFSGGLQLTRDLSLAAVDVIKALTSETRSHSDKLKVYKFLLEQPFFLDAERSKLEVLSERASYYYYAPGQRIIRQGDLGDYFYMLLKGRVDVSVSGVGWVDYMEEPASFGDLALTSDEARQASVYAATAVHVVRLAKEDFQDVMKGWKEKQQEDVCDFLSKLQMFSSWSRTRLTRLVGRIQVKNPRMGDTIMTQGKPPPNVFIVRKGTLAIRHATEIPHENRWPASNDTVELALENAERLGLKRSGKGQVVFTENAPPSAAEGGAAMEKGAGAAAGGGAAAPVLDSTAAAAFTGGPVASVTSRSRQLAASVSATGIPFLPVPLARPNGPEDSHAQTHRTATQRSSGSLGSPAPRERGWGAGSPGGTLAYSPSKSSRREGEKDATLRGYEQEEEGRAPPAAGPLASPSTGGVRSAIRSTPTKPTSPKSTGRHGLPLSSRSGQLESAEESSKASFLDSSRVLPTEVRFVVNTIDSQVGTAGPGALLGLQQCLRGQVSPFTVQVTEPGCTLLYFSKEYLKLVPSEESLKYGAPPNPLLATILSDGACAHTLKALTSLGMCLNALHKERVGQELVADAALAKLIASKPNTKVTSASLRASAKAVAMAVSSKDPAMLLSLVPMNSEEAGKIIWTMVAKLADEVHSNRFGKPGSEGGGAHNVAEGAKVQVGSPHASFGRSSIAGALFARAPEDSAPP